MIDFDTHHVVDLSPRMIGRITRLDGTVEEGNKDVFRTELRVVAPDEDSPLKKELFDETTIFFKNSEFRDWLKERGLVSS